MVTDVLADSLIRIKNASLRKSKKTILMNSNLVKGVLAVLKHENFIKDFEEKDSKSIEVTLLYDEGEAAATHFEKVSKQGQRVYVTSKEIVPVMNGRGIGILSTSSGVMSTPVAKAKDLGGEYLCKIW